MTQFLYAALAFVMVIATVAGVGFGLLWLLARRMS